MSNENNDSQAAPQEPARQFAIQKIYVKDLSFETPNSPQVFTEKWEPEVGVDLNTGGKSLGSDVYEVVLSLTITVKLKDKTAYLTEVQQAGIFTLKGFEEQDLGAMLGSYCPNILFPFAREVVSDLVSKGGFPPLLLSPVNFDALYAQHLERQQQPGGKQDVVH